MADKIDKVVLEREYIVPLRSVWMKAVYYKRAAKAIKALKIFLAKHMKVEDRDVRKVKLDRYVNEEIWFRGIRKPLNKIKVKAKKMESGVVIVELVDVPKIVQFRMDKEKKRTEVKTEKKVEEKTEKEEKTEDEKKSIEEKQDAVKEAGLKHAEEQAKQMKHEAKTKQGPKHQRRMALQK